MSSLLKTIQTKREQKRNIEEPRLFESIGDVKTLVEKLFIVTGYSFLYMGICFLFCTIV